MTKYSKELMEDVVRKSVSYSDIARAFGLEPIGGNLGHMKELTLKYGLDTSHFTGKGHYKGKVSTRKRVHSLVLVDSRKREQGYRLKRALIESGREEKCEHCGVGPTWNGKSLTLIADHINGDRLNHSASNLQILCPNCHSQTETFAGRNKGLRGVG